MTREQDPRELTDANGMVQWRWWGCQDDGFLEKREEEGMERGRGETGTEEE